MRFQSPQRAVRCGCAPEQRPLDFRHALLQHRDGSIPSRRASAGTSVPLAARMEAVIPT
jgi:hypothetical protein